MGLTTQLRGSVVPTGILLDVSIPRWTHLVPSPVFFKEVTFHSERTNSTPGAKVVTNK